MLNYLPSDTFDTGSMHHIGMLSATAFCRYLQQYHLNALDVSIASAVRYVTIWRIQKGLPVLREHATQTRRGLHTLTHVAYIAPIAVLPTEEDEQERSLYFERS